MIILLRQLVVIVFNLRDAVLKSSDPRKVGLERLLDFALEHQRPLLLEL